MNVGELKELLSQYPDDLEVIYQLYSDYDYLCAGHISLIEAVDKGSYLMRSHSTMSDENKEKSASYLCFPGN
jgi:hypothetical protein